MSTITNSLYSMRVLDEQAKKETCIHKLHPLIKLVTTMTFLIIVVSFDKYEIIGLLPLAFYPVIIFTVAELPIDAILKRALFIEPLIIGIGILNPIFDHSEMIIYGMTVSRGWITFISIFMKCHLTVLAAMILIATTGMEQIASALRMFKVPKIFVLQLLLTYRYITVLIEEFSKMLMAYSLRAPEQKGLHISVWGSFAGQMIIRSFDRAQRVYEAMSLRGFNGEYNAGDLPAVKLKDWAYLACWILFFVAARVMNIPLLMGELLTGVIK